VIVLRWLMTPLRSTLLLRLLVVVVVAEEEEEMCRFTNHLVVMSAVAPWCRREESGEGCWWTWLREVVEVVEEEGVVQERRRGMRSLVRSFDGLERECGGEGVGALVMVPRAVGLRWIVRLVGDSLLLLVEVVVKAERREGFLAKEGRSREDVEVGGEEENERVWSGLLGRRRRAEGWGMCTTPARAWSLVPDRERKRASNQ
jgi:hypothetical protein